MPLTPTNPIVKFIVTVETPKPKLRKVIHNNTHTIALFDDGSKVVTKPNGDDYDGYLGFCVAMTAKYFGSKKAAHEAYEKYSGRKHNEPKEQVATFGEMVQNATAAMQNLGEMLRNANVEKRQEEEPNAEPLQNSQSTYKYCYNCEYFNVSLNLEPCKSCRQIRTDDNRYPKWTAPKGKVPKPGKVILPEQDDEGLPFRRCRNCKHVALSVDSERCTDCYCTKDHISFEKKEVNQNA